MATDDSKGRIDPEEFAAAAAALPTATKWAQRDADTPDGTPDRDFGDAAALLPRDDRAASRSAPPAQAEAEVYDDDSGENPALANLTPAETLSECLALPLRWPGPLWLGVIASTVCIAGTLTFFVALTSPVPGIGVSLGLASAVALSVALDVQLKFFHATLVSAHRLRMRPRFEPWDWIGWTSAFSPLFLLVVASAPLVLTSSSPWLLRALAQMWMLAVVAYWPVAAFQMATHDVFHAAWDIPSGVRAIRSAPRAYAMVVAAGALAFVASGIVWRLGHIYVGSALGRFMVGILLFGAPLGYVHGVVGAMMGRLARDHPEFAVAAGATLVAGQPSDDASSGSSSAPEPLADEEQPPESPG